MSSACLVFAWLLLMQAQSDEDIVAAARAAKAEDVKAAQNLVDAHNESLKAAIRARDSGKVKELRTQVRDASLELARTRNRSLDEYVERERKAMEERHAEAEEERKRREDRSRKAERQAANRERAREERRKVGPIYIESAVVARNAIGLPELNLRVTNNSDETIDAFDFEAECLTGFDEPVNSLTGDNMFAGACVTPIRPGAEKFLSVQLSLHRGTAKARVRVTRAKAESGKVWKQTREEANGIPGAIITANPPKAR